MVGTSKILTVSYGTFSCTLEGFDDPFSTMKSISEYFRDLAAEDRYFGAEPPTPDAEMLQRIAEREIQRRVEARVQDSSLVLRQLEDAPEQAPATAPQTQTTATSIAALAAAAAAEAPAEEIAPDVSVKDTAEETYEAETAFAPEAEPTAQLSDQPEPEAMFDSEVELVEPAPAPKADTFDGDSIAAKLSRIRAVVSGAAPEPGYTEDEHAEESLSASLNTMFDDEEGDEAFDTVAEALGADEDITPSADAVLDEGNEDQAELEDSDELEETSFVVEEPAELDDVSVVEEQAVDEDAAEEPALDAPTMEDTVADEPVVDEPMAAMAEDEPAQDFVAEDDTSETQIEEPVAEAPAAEETLEDEAEATVAEEDTVEAEEIDFNTLVLDTPFAASDEDAADSGFDDEDNDAQESGLAAVAAELSDDELSEELAESDDSEGTLSALIGTLSLDDESDEAEDLYEEVDEFDAAEDADDPFGSIFAANADDDETAEDDDWAEAAETDDEAELAREAELAEEDIDIVGTAEEDSGASEIAEEAVDDTSLVQRARARIIKMRRQDAPEAFLAQQDADETHEDDAEDLTHQIAESLGAGSLSDEDENDLIAQLAAAAAADEAEHKAEQKAAREQRASFLEENPIDESGAVGRLLEETDRAFSNSEGSRRRSAIQHLKAAVLARRSDETSDEELDEESVKSRFQDDLARVVKPTRPIAGEAKKVDRRLAPLMLVSEQRVDLADDDALTSSALPVRPRRISAGNLALSNDEDAIADQDNANEDRASALSDADSFAEYAEQVGAEDLTDLLEAAAAYTAYVEGQPHFSRPQIMRAVANLKADDGFTREDGLRSFGMLLRAGKIKKLKRGQFIVAEDTKFKPEMRAAGE